MKQLKNKIFLSKKSYCFFVIIFSFISHFIALNFQPVNDEYIFFKGADFIATFEKDIIQIFFEYNANTLGFSYLIFFFKFVLPFLETSQISKILSFFSLLLFAVASKNLYLIFKPKIKFIFFFTLILFNPLLWNYSFRGIPDTISAGLCLFSITQIILSKDDRYNIFYIILFSIGVIIKPFNSILLIILIYFQFFKKKERIQSSYLILIFIVINFIYFKLNFYLFKFYITPPLFSDVFNPSFKSYIITFLSYLGFVVFFTYPFLFIRFITKSLSKNIKINLILYFITLILSYWISLKINFDLTEMNFGYISNFINPNIFAMILIFNNIIFIIYIFKNIKFQKVFLIIFLILIFILIMSFTHSAQRYLMVMTPLVYIIFVKIYHNKYDYFLTFIAYVIINLIIFINLFNNHKTISDTVIFLKNNNLISITDPGYIGQHALNNFTNFYKKKQKIEKSEIFDNKIYKVVNNVNNEEKIIFKTSSDILFFKKSLFVIRN